jgi:manganese/zinc/iron transport system permease protein
MTLFDDATLRTVSLGTAGLGAVTGLVGAFAVVRRQSLQGDAVSHAALPGLAVAFLLGARSPALLVVGAAVSGWVAMALVGGIVRRSRVPFDTALGGVLSVFFGVGLALMVYIRKLVQRPVEALWFWELPLREWLADVTEHGLERYLFGQAAIMRGEDLRVIGLAGAVIGLAVALLWKEFKLLSFDPDFAAASGLPVRALDLLLTALVVVAVVIGLQAVGVVLMSTLLVAPAVAARQWTDRLGRLALLAAAFGAAAGLAGTVLSDALSAPRRPVPTGPTIVLCATALAVASILFAPRRGFITRRLFRPVPEAA